MNALATLPDSLLANGDLEHGLFVGQVAVGSLDHVPGPGRERRWWYAAFASEDDAVVFGAAVVDLGMVGTAFVWLSDHGVLHETSTRLFGSQVSVGRTPIVGARGRARGLQVTMDGRGGFRLEARDLGGRRVSVDLQTDLPGPVVCSTATPNGGRNVTQKAAGHGGAARLVVDGHTRSLEGHAWYDWTAGRQDRRTSWRWAAGAGRCADGRRVGLNISTGMNAAGAGENVVWFDGVPTALDVTSLGPEVAGRFDGPWLLSGKGWELRFVPSGVRAARENLLLVRSAYVQPVGRFTGTLPAADGVVAVDFAGVTEDHQAVW